MTRLSGSDCAWYPKTSQRQRPFACERCHGRAEFAVDRLCPDREAPEEMRDDEMVRVGSARVRNNLQFLNWFIKLLISLVSPPGFEPGTY